MDFKDFHGRNNTARIKLNKAIIKWHLNKEKREAAQREKKEKDRLHALKRDNEEEYIKMLQETKNGATFFFFCFFHFFIFFLF